MLFLFYIMFNVIHCMMKECSIHYHNVRYTLVQNVSRREHVNFVLYYVQCNSLHDEGIMYRLPQCLLHTCAEHEQEEPVIKVIPCM